MAKLLGEIFTRNVTRDQCKDAGMAFTLILILLGLIYRHDYILVVAIGLLVITMTAPMIYKGLAMIWFGLAEVVGNIISKIILSVIFFMVVTPIGAARRLLQKDSLRLYEFKRSRESVMEERNQTFGPKDIEKPY
jgi:multisubunit Na+/H+ antiporter MnhG subunit